jgi:hypothetical protein
LLLEAVWNSIVSVASKDRWLLRATCFSTYPSRSVSSSVRSFYCQCLSMDIAWLCDRFYTPVSNGCGWNRLIH